MNMENNQYNNQNGNGYAGYNPSSSSSSASTDSKYRNPNNDNDDQGQGFMPNQLDGYGPKSKLPSSSLYNDENSMVNADSAMDMMKNSAMSPDYPQNDGVSPFSESYLNHFSNGNKNFNNGLKQDHDSSPLNMPSPSDMDNVNDFGSFAAAAGMAGAQPFSEMNGIAGFQPAPEGGQLSAPPGYKHVGYITIPTGAANLPSMMSQPNHGLPIIRPIAINGATLSKLNPIKGDGKKNQDQKTSESKVMKSFLSRLNPLNMLRRFRQRRERRQTSDSNDYLPLSAKYASNYGYSSPFSYGTGAGGGAYGGMSPMSSLGASMYPGMSSASMYMPSPAASYNSYPLYSSYPGYGYGPASPSSSYMSPSKSGPSSEMVTSASAMNPSGMVMSPSSPMSPMSPMMMSPMGMANYGPMSGYQSMAMPYPGYPGMHSHHAHHMPLPYSSPQSSSSSSSSSQSSSNEQTNSLQNSLPGGINLSDLLKDEEEESKFKKFLGYINPVKMFKRFRNNSDSSDDKKRYSRFRRSVPIVMLSRNDSSSSLDNHQHDDDDMNDHLNEQETLLKPLHETKKKSKHSKSSSLLGSGNYELIRGGTFQMKKMHSLASSKKSSDSNNNNNEDDFVSNLRSGLTSDQQELLGFQGFNGFAYNPLQDSSNHRAELSISSSSSSEDDRIKRGHTFQSIEPAALASTELKATS